MGRAGVARELVDPGRLLGREVGGAKNLALTEDRPDDAHDPPPSLFISAAAARSFVTMASGRSEEHTSELQSLMRISYAVFCLKKQKNTNSMIEYLKACTPTNKPPITTT